MNIILCFNIMSWGQRLRAAEECRCRSGMETKHGWIARQLVENKVVCRYGYYS